MYRITHLTWQAKLLKRYSITTKLITCLSYITNIYLVGNNSFMTITEMPTLLFLHADRAIYEHTNKTKCFVCVFIDGFVCLQKNS